MQEKILKAEDRVKLLQPVKRYYDQYNLLQQEITQIKEQLQTAAIWKNFSLHQLLQTAVEEKEAEIKEIENRQSGIKENVRRLAEEERQLVNRIDQNKAGQRMQQMERDIADLTLKEKKPEGVPMIYKMVLNCSYIRNRTNR